MDEHTLGQLKQAIERALESGDLFDPAQLDEMRQRLQQLSAEQRNSLLDRLVNKLEDAGYINTEGKPPESPSAPGGAGGPESQLRFEVTDKAVDFLDSKH